jgi:hypothetical protein
MVNRDTNFNRRKVKRLKSIRDLKKARITKKKQNYISSNIETKPLTKKEEKRQRRLNRIYKEFEDKKISLNNIGKKDKHIRRRNRRREAKQNNANKNTEMMVDDS